MELCIKYFATLKLSCSNWAGPALFGVARHADPGWKVLYCGIDMDPLHLPSNSNSLRKAFGLPDEALVLVHVGRFEPLKNHSFLIDIFKEFIKEEPDSYLLLIGDGELRLQVEEKVCDLGIENNVKFLGLRHDVPAILSQAIDIFVLPSLSEGLCLALVESQAAGLSCVVSDTVPTEAIVVNDLVTRVPLDHPPTLWAHAIKMAVEKKNGERRSSA